MSVISKKTWCPRPGCDGEFVRNTGMRESGLFMADNSCSKCDYKKATILGPSCSPAAGNIRYVKDGKRVLYTDER